MNQQEEQQPLFAGNDTISATEFLAMVEAAAKFPKLNVADRLRLYRERPDAMFMETEEYYRQKSSYIINEGEEGFETSDWALLYDITQTDCPEEMRQAFALPDIAKRSIQEKYENLVLLTKQCGIMVDESEKDVCFVFYPEHNMIHIPTQGDTNEKLNFLCLSLASEIVEKTTTQFPEHKKLDFECLYMSTCLHLGVEPDGITMPAIIDLVEEIGQSDRKGVLLRNKRMTDMVATRIQENITLARQEIPHSTAPMVRSTAAEIAELGAIRQEAGLAP